LHGDLAPSPERGGASSPIFGPYLLWPNGWMDQDGTWHGGWPWFWPHCARWGTRSSPTKKGAERPPIFGPFLLSPNRWMNQDGFGTEIGLGPSHIVLDGDSAPLPKKGAEPPLPPIFGPCLLWPNG